MEEKLQKIENKLDIILKLLNHKGSFYKIIDGERYLRYLLNLAEEYEHSGGRVSLEEVDLLLEEIKKDNKLSEIEIKSLNYKFMNVICDTKISKRHLIPGVVNLDNTSRPQLVERKDNNLYYDLINEFYKLSKVPILLNTSLNIMEPICRNSADTISSFLQSEIDILAIGNSLIKKIK